MGSPELQERYRTLLRICETKTGSAEDARWSAERDLLAYEVDGRRHVLDALSGSETMARAGEFDLPPLVRAAARIGRRDVREVPGSDRTVSLTEDGPNLALRWRSDGRVEPLTANGTALDRWEVKGAKWAPNGLSFAARKVDMSGVDHFAVVHWLKSREEIEYIPYVPVAGRPAREELYIVEARSRQVVRVDSGDEPDRDLRPLGWRADSGEFYYLKTNRLHNPLVLMAADPETGASRTVYEERSSTFVSYWERGYQCYLTPGGDRHIWLSQRDGWSHLYLHGMDGAQLVQLTSGEWVVTDLIGFDSAAEVIYFHAHSDASRLYDVHVGRVRMDGTGLSWLTEGAGAHHAVFSASGEYFVDMHRTMLAPPATSVRRANGELVCQLDQPELASDSGWTPPVEFKVTAADGVTPIYGQLYLPSDLDPDKRYPVIDSIYAGPNSAYVPTDMLSETAVRARALSALGFAVMIVDGRGTPERSKAFHDVVYRQFGRHEIADHVAAVQQLGASHPNLDLARVGVFGRSYGGYFAVRALLTAPETFHVGVAINAVYDLDDEGQGPVECCMGELADNLDGYDFGSNSKLVDQLGGKLLLVHGTADVNVQFGSTMKFCETLLRADKQFDFLPVNEQPHHFSGVSGAYVNLAIARYFVRHLVGKEL